MGEIEVFIDFFARNSLTSFFLLCRIVMSVVYSSYILFLGSKYLAEGAGWQGAQGMSFICWDFDEENDGVALCADLIEARELADFHRINLCFKVGYMGFER